MDTPCPYKRAKTCAGKNFQTIVETVPYTTIDVSQISSLVMKCGFTCMSPRYITKYGQLKEVKDLA
jgi:hypothetical protein